MTEALRATHHQPPATRGIHHLALNTDDMKATVDFYTRVLGMPLVHALRAHKPGPCTSSTPMAFVWSFLGKSTTAMTCGWSSAGPKPRPRRRRS